MAETPSGGGSGIGLGTGSASSTRSRRELAALLGDHAAAGYSLTILLAVVIGEYSSYVTRKAVDRGGKTLWEFDKWGRPKFKSAREQARRKARDWASEQKDKVQRRLTDYRDSVGSVRGKRGSRRRSMSHDFAYKY